MEDTMISTLLLLAVPYWPFVLDALRKTLAPVRAEGSALSSLLRKTPWSR